MPFDLNTAIAVKETEDRVDAGSEFNLNSARPITGDNSHRTAYEDYFVQTVNKQVKEAMLRPMSAKEYNDIPEIEKSDPGAFYAGMLPYSRQMIGLVTRPFGFEPTFDRPFGLKKGVDIEGRKREAELKEEHPVAYTIGELAGGIVPYILVAPLFPQNLLGVAATFATVGGAREIGRLQTEESLLTPPGKKALILGKEVTKEALKAPIWYYGGMLKFVGRPFLSSTLRAGTKGAGVFTLESFFGTDLEDAFKQGGMITALSLIFEAPMLAKTALGRGIITQSNRIAKDKGLPSGKVTINVDRLDMASTRVSMFRLVKDFYKLSKHKVDAAEAQIKAPQEATKFLSGPNVAPPPKVTPTVPKGKKEIEALKKIPEKAPVELAKIELPDEPLTKADIGNIIDTNLQKEIKALEEQKDKRVSKQEQLNLEIANIQATIKAIDEQQEFSEMGEHIFPDKQEILKDLKTDLKIKKEKVAFFQPKKEVVTVEKRLKEKITNIQRGFRKGVVKTKVEISRVQEEIIQLLEQSELEAHDKAKFVRAIKNIQTAQQLSKALPEIQERIGRIEEAVERRELIAEIQELTSPSELKGLRPEFRKQIEPLLTEVDLVKRTKGKIKGLNKLAEFVASNPDNQIPQKRLEELRILEGKPIDEVSTEALQLILDSVNNFIKQNELKNKLIIKGKLRQKEVIVDQAIKNVQSRPQAKPNSITGLDSFQQNVEAKAFKKIFGVDAYNAELKCEILDGKDFDIINEVIYGGIDKGIDTELEFDFVAKDFFKEKFGDIDIDSWSKVFQTKAKNIEKVRAGSFTMTKAERISFILHSRNPQSTKHMVEGGVSFVETPQKIIKIGPGDIDEIVVSATPKELQVADALSEYFNTIQKDRINEVSTRLLGHEIAREDNYFPIRTNWLDRFKDKLIQAERAGFSQQTLEGLGIFKERQNASNGIIIEDAFVAAFKSIKQVGAYVGLAEPLRSAKTLLEDNDFQKTVIDAGLKHYLDSLKDYLKRIEGAAINNQNVDRLAVELINKLDMAILGINPYVAFKQAISYFGADTEMDSKYLKDSFSLKVTDAEMAEVNKYAPQLRDRFEGNVTRELGELARVGAVKRFFTEKEVIAQKVMIGIRKMDQGAIMSIWRAVKKEVSANNPELKGDAYFEKVYERAWKIIRRTQPTFHVKDRSTIGQNPDIFIRLLTKYSSQRNKNYMMLRRSFEKFNRSAKTNADKSRLLRTIGILAVLSPLFLIAIDELRDLARNKKQKQALFQRTIGKFISTVFGSVYFIGPMINSIISKIERGTWGGYDVDLTVTSFMNDIGDTISSLVRGIDQAVKGEKFKSGAKRGQEKWKTSIGNAFVTSLDIIGLQKGIPVKNIRKLLAIPFIQRKEKKIR